VEAGPVLVCVPLVLDTGLPPPRDKLKQTA
jgi:hypothetical protein